jgi:hypothetical protein
MTTFENFNQELASIDMEIARWPSCAASSMLQPGVAEAVLRGDSSLCNSTNPLAWDKLRGLLVLHYHVVPSGGRRRCRRRRRNPAPGAAERQRRMRPQQ